MCPLEPDKNVVLIGMPGAGKSTVGVLLAKVLSRQFLDTDVYIQAREGRRLQDIIDTDGMEAFCRLEERYMVGLERTRHVIATGGSVVYGDAAMTHLRLGGVIVHLDLSLEALRRRLTDLDTRGVVMAPGETLEQLFEERQPLYRHYADLTVNCEGLTHEQVVSHIVRLLVV